MADVSQLFERLLASCATAEATCQREGRGERVGTVMGEARRARSVDARTASTPFERMLVLRKLAAMRYACWELFDAELRLLATLQRVREEILIEGWLEDFRRQSRLGSAITPEEEDLRGRAIERKQDYQAAKWIVQQDPATVEPAVWRGSVAVLRAWSGRPESEVEDAQAGSVD